MELSVFGHEVIVPYCGFVAPHSLHVLLLRGMRVFVDLLIVIAYVTSHPCSVVLISAVKVSTLVRKIVMINFRMATLVPQSTRLSGPHLSRSLRDAPHAITEVS